MKTTSIILVAIMLLMVGSFAACEKSEPNAKACNVDNPLTDLPWLKEIVDELESSAYKPHAKIYRCACKDSTVFLVNTCIACYHSLWELRRCDGTTLCTTPSIDMGLSEQLKKDHPCMENIVLSIESMKPIWEVVADTIGSACELNNPTEELPWLKAIVAANPSGAEIYRCAYRDGVGFWVNLCVQCPDYASTFVNCAGEPLCFVNGFAVGNTCTELNIDFDTKKLIWENP